MEEKINIILKEVFGYSSFRPFQKDIILNILQDKDVFAVMPTGFGKSLCYYIPAILKDGVSLVVCPLISLMEDQVKFLKSKGIKAEQINSRLTKGMCRKILNDTLKLKYKILYVAPERLVSKIFLDLAYKFEISMIVIDEAHSISNWGKDFRTSYVKMLKFFNLLKKRPVFACFTATATLNVKNYISNLLKLKDPFCVNIGVDRSNLFIDIIKIKREYKLLKLISLVRKFKNKNGIIYCSTRYNVEYIFKILKEKGFSVAKYHAGLRLIQRQRNQKSFLVGDKRILVATNAFGMGVHKQDVRFIIHFNMPQNLENYYQEIGRAGRDGMLAFCFMLFSEDDVSINTFFIENTKNDEFNEDEIKNLKLKKYKELTQIINFCKSRECYKKTILRYFGEETQQCNNCGNCLKNRNFIIKIINFINRIFKERR